MIRSVLAAELYAMAYRFDIKSDIGEDIRSYE